MIPMMEGYLKNELCLSSLFAAPYEGLFLVAGNIAYIYGYDVCEEERRHNI